MARRGSRTTHAHAVRHPDGSDPMTSRWLWGVTWCGETGGSSLSNMPEGEDPKAYSRRMSDCPKCSAAIGKARMRQLGDRIKLEKVEEKADGSAYGSYYRTAYLVTVDGEPMAHVVMKNGWGNPWELKDIRDPEDRMSYTGFGSTVSDIPMRHNKVDADKLIQVVHGASKEMMACAAVRMRDAGQLFTVEEKRVRAAARKVQQQEEAAQRERDREAYQAARAVKDAARAERKATALAGLVEFAKRADLGNLELAAISAAIDIIEGRDVA